MNVVRLSDMTDGIAESGGVGEPPDEEPVLSVAQAARGLGLSRSTVRQYIADHPAHIETRREGRNIMILLRSFPVLARIRDLRRHRLPVQEIERRLNLSNEDVAVSGGDGKAGADSPDAVLETALSALRKEVAGLKRELRDNELVIRQSLATVLFLIEKNSKEIEFHATEERLANRERDFLLTGGQHTSANVGVNRRKGRRGLRALLASLVPTPASSSR